MPDGEKFNCITHIIGFLLALFGLVALVVATMQRHDILPLTSVSVYGVSLVLVYVFSSLNHSSEGKAKKLFQKLDFISIYILIAGTYTPFSLITLRDSWGIPILILVWGLAFLGIYLECKATNGKRVRPMLLYLLMGWVILLAVKPLIIELGWTGFMWLLIGGFFYTSGIIFYIYDENVKHFHGIWHLCVLAGSITQFIAVYYYVL